jgi:hypothetical protein
MGRQTKVVCIQAHEVQRPGHLGQSGGHCLGRPQSVQSNQARVIKDSIPSLMFDHLASIHSNLSTLDYNSKSHVNSILNKLDTKCKETLKAMKIMTDQKQSVPQYTMETNERIVTSLSKLNELGLVNIQTNERMNSSLIKNNDLGLINNNKVSFETDQFDPTKHNAHDWCLVQKRRLECIYKNLPQEDINEKILDKCEDILNMQSDAKWT